MTPREIWKRAARLSHNGYNTTVIAEQKHQIIPMTTHAVSPPTPKMVLAKKSGSGTRMSRTRVYGTKLLELIDMRDAGGGERLRTRTADDHAAKRNALSSETGSRSGSGSRPLASSFTAECVSAQPSSFSDTFSESFVFSSLYGLATVETGTRTFNARVDTKSKSSGHCLSKKT
jgi:hypothetical protein